MKQRTLWGDEEHPNPRRPWSHREDERLSESWGVIPVARISAELGRPEDIVSARAKRLRLAVTGHESLSAAAKRTGFSPKEIRYICWRYNVTIQPSGVDPAFLDAAIHKWMQTESVAHAARCRGLRPSELRTILIKAGHEPPRDLAKWRVETTAIDRAIEGA